MNDKLTLQALVALANSPFTHKQCDGCVGLICDGWESIPATFDRKQLELIGSMRSDDAMNNWRESHPLGTNSWSVNAPIAFGYHPYNKCDIYQCISCARKYLRYTEYGGYYLDERIRFLNPALITNSFS